MLRPNRDRPIGEQMAHEGFLQFARRSDDLLRRLDGALNGGQHVGNGALLGERRKRNQEVFKNGLVNMRNR